MMGLPVMPIVHDLNLLTVFRALDETRHVTRAAKSLGVTQSALSHALRRMRVAFGDPMFVKTPRGMVLTPFAESVAEPIRDTLARLEHDVFARGTFKPEALARTFRIRATDYVESLVVPRLLGAMAKESPGSRIAVTPTSSALPKEELEAGACDLAVAGFFGELPDGFFQQVIFTDAFACGARRNLSKLDLDEFCDARHVIIAPGGELTGAVDRALAKRRKKRRVVAGASSFMSGCFIAAHSDAIVTAPARLLALLAPAFKLHVVAPPLALPEIKVAQVWHTRSHRDPAHQWMRELVSRATTDRPGA